MKNRNSKKYWRLAKFLWDEIWYPASDYYSFDETPQRQKDFFYDKAKRVYHMVGYNE